MQKALIISDNPFMARSLEKEFSASGWTSNSVGVAAMIDRGSSSLNHYQCMALVIDADFCKRFDSALAEMCVLFRNLAREVPFYLIFERDYDPGLAAWLAYTRRIFKSTSKHQMLKEAIEEITRLEMVPPHSSAFVSPMQSI